MLKRHAPEIYSLLSDSETESDDNNFKGPKIRDVSGPSKINGEGSHSSKRNDKGKSISLSDNKADEDKDEAMKGNGEGSDKRKDFLSDKAVRVPITFRSQDDEVRDEAMKRNGEGSARQKVVRAPTTVRSQPDGVQGNLEELAKKYQKQIKIIPVPEARIANVIFFTWEELAKSLRSLYGQPIHYLTYKLCKQWDESRIGSEDERKALASMFKVSYAESTIWSVEKIHRLTTSPTHLAKLWIEDPNYYAVVAEVLPAP